MGMPARSQPAAAGGWRMTIELRPYQAEAVEAFYQSIRDKKEGNGLIEHATGLGKSIIIAKIASDMAGWGRRVLVLAHVKELLEQNHAKLQALLPDVPVGLYSAGLGKREIKQWPLVAGIQSIHNKADELFPPPDIAIVDECHLIPTKGTGMYQRLLKSLWQQNPRMKLLGLTATPYRLQGGSLLSGKDRMFHHVVHRYGIAEGIQGDYLAPIVSKVSSVQADLTGLKTVNGDFKQDEMALRFSPEMTMRALQDLLTKAHDRHSILIFAANVEHAEFITECLDGAAMIDGATHKETRARLIEDFKAKRLRFLVNVNVLTTGFDAPNVDCIAIIRATKSAGLYVQIVGRGTRKAPGKENCLLLDFGGNIERFGPVDHIKIKSNGSDGDSVQTAPVKVCPKCEEAVHASSRECPACHYLFPAPKAEHTAIASQAAVLASTGEDDIRKVSHWWWERYKGKAGKPDTVLITYFCGLASFKQWICPEHEGYARTEYIKFCRMFGHPLFKTVEETLTWWRMENPNSPARIKVKRNASGYWNVLEHTKEMIYGQKTDTVGR